MMEVKYICQITTQNTAFSVKIGGWMAGRIDLKEKVQTELV